MRRTTRISFGGLAALLALWSGPATRTAAAQAADERAADAPVSLPAAARILGQARDIVAPDGIETLERIELGGIPQWISVRGHDRRNPVLLFLHGGPGFPMMPASHLHQAPWEEYFTVVQWDQRGTGKTYSASDPASVAPTLTVERMVADAEELVRALRTRYGKEKIVLVGHSWGSLLGVELARRHPEWFHVYVGLGQVVDMPTSERMAYDSLLARAARAGDSTALAELRVLAPYPEPHGAMPVSKLYAQRKWLRAYGGYTWRRPDDHYFDLVRLSPDYTEADVVAFGPAIEFVFRAIWPQVATWNISDVTSLDLPVVLIHGVHDLTTSPVLAERWYRRLRAPSKQFVRFERSAHMVQMEEPGRLFLHLVQDVRPFAAANGDAPAAGR